MKCSKCGRRANAKRSSCMYCGGKFVQEERKADLRCCSCNSPMQEEDRHGIMIDVCPNCQSIWFDSGELEALLKLEETPDLEEEAGRYQTGKSTRFTPDAAQTPYRKCPYCERFMAQQNYKKFSGIIIDSCRLHGIFLDAMEFEKIQLFEAIP